jgi:hypothetical protein
MEPRLPPPNRIVLADPRTTPRTSLSTIKNPSPGSGQFEGTPPDRRERSDAAETKLLGSKIQRVYERRSNMENNLFLQECRIGGQRLHESRVEDRAEKQ